MQTDKFVKADGDSEARIIMAGGCGGKTKTGHCFVIRTRPSIYQSIITSRCGRGFRRDGPPGRINRKTAFVGV